MGAHDPIPSILETPGNKSTVTLAGGAFRNSTHRPDRESRPPVDLPLHAREILGPPPLFRSAPHIGDHPGLATLGVEELQEGNIINGFVQDPTTMKLMAVPI
jgi:hypothetical protein